MILALASCRTDRAMLADLARLPPAAQASGGHGDRRPGSARMTRPVIHHFGHMEFPEEHGLDDIDPMTVAIDQAAEYLHGALRAGRGASVEPQALSARGQ